MHIKYIIVYVTDYSLYNFLTDLRSCHFKWIESANCFSSHFSLLAVADCKNSKRRLLPYILFFSLSRGPNSSVWHQVGTQWHLLYMLLIQQPAKSMHVFLRLIPWHILKGTKMWGFAVLCRLEGQSVSTGSTADLAFYKRQRKFIIGTNLVPFPRTKHSTQNSQTKSH